MIMTQFISGFILWVNLSETFFLRTVQVLGKRVTPPYKKESIKLLYRINYSLLALFSFKQEYCLDLNHSMWSQDEQMLLFNP